MPARPLAPLLALGWLLTACLVNLPAPEGPVHSWWEGHGAVIPHDLQRQWLQGTGPAAKPNSPVQANLRNVAYALLSGADGWMFDASYTWSKAEDNDSNERSVSSSSVWNPWPKQAGTNSIVPSSARSSTLVHCRKVGESRRRSTITS